MLTAQLSDNVISSLAEGVGFGNGLNLYLILRISDSATPLVTPTHLKTYLIYLRVSTVRLPYSPRLLKVVRSAGILFESADSYILRHLTLVEEFPVSALLADR